MKHRKLLSIVLSALLCLVMTTGAIAEVMRDALTPIKVDNKEKQKMEENSHGTYCRCRFTKRKKS